MLNTLSQKQKIIFFIILTIMIIVIIYYFYLSIYQNNYSIEYENLNLINNEFLKDTNNTNINNLENQKNNYIVVYICGAVKENKVITLKENSRICDAIEAVGGLTKDADLTNINLAYILEDGEKIYIPKQGEEYLSENISPVYSSSTKNNKININKATQTELETIPSIGPSTALKIIEYRQKNGRFSNIEEIKNISGIGDTKYEKIKEYIIVK